MRRLLFPLTPLYAAAVAAKNTAYDRGWLGAQRLQRPVISVGNISVGGSGKTPLVIYLAELLAQSGLKADVLSRGYGRNTDATERVDPGGNAERFGDEPLLIAQSAQVPVYVGASRYAAGLLAEKEHHGPAKIHLLDDGFQHRQLVRDVDIVVVHRSDFAETLLPAGRLREPLSALKRASILVLREEDAGLGSQLKRRGIDMPIWWIKRSIRIPQNTGRTLAFCGIARPDEFFHSLRANGIEPIATHAFRDHHRYSSADIQQLIQAAKMQTIDSFLTTEKDFVRLSQDQRDILSSAAPLRTVKLTVRLRDEAAVLDQLLALLPAIPSRPL